MSTKGGRAHAALVQAIEILRELEHLDGDDLAAAAHRRCEGNGDLLNAVRMLLDGAEPDSEGIQRDLDADLGLGSTPDPSTTPSVDGITISHLIGSGGAGDVYAGRQESPERDVAVKVLRSGHSSRRAVHRFAREGRALAAIQHPSVAAIHAISEARLASGGVAPCLIMEYVLGDTLASVSEAIPLRRAAQLAAKIARGLHAAHQRGIIHRDLKPSNVMIDQAGQPRIIDFGVAALHTSDDTPRHTVTGELLGTLGYMSPEQIDGSADVADVRIDVYAVGVLFYELLTGKAAVETGTTSSIHAIQAIMRGALPKLPLGGDADAVYRKATELDPFRRYESAAALADDLERLADARPVSARPPSWVYLASRLVRRRPVSSSLAALAVAVIFSFGAAAVWGFSTASRERDSALIAEARAREAASFLRGMLTSPDPDQDGPDVRVIDVLNRSAEQIDTLHGDDPLVAMDLHRTIGWTYTSLSKQSEAQTHLSSALAIAHDQFADDDPEVLLLECDVAESEVQLGQIESALDRMTRTNRRMRATTDLPPQTRAAVLMTLGEVLRNAGKADEAFVAIDEARDMLLSVSDTSDPQFRATLSALGRTYLEQSLATAGREVFESLLATFSAHEVGSASWFIARSNLATALATEGRHEEAIPIYEEVLEAGPPVLGEMHFTLRMVRNILPDSYIAVGEPDKALETSARAVGDALAVYGPDTTGELMALNNHAVLLMQLEKYESALPITARLAEQWPRLLAPEHPHALRGLRNHAAVLDRLGRDAEAVASFRDIAAIQQATLGDAHFDTIVTKNNLAHLLEKLGESEEAAQLMQSVVDHSGPDSGLPPPARGIFQLNLGRSLISLARFEEAETALEAASTLYPVNESHQNKVREARTRLIAARDGRDVQTEPNSDDPI
ncbi:MAG: serine/threonine-protein kinase [Planctomycetota bacterium]